MRNRTANFVALSAFVLACFCSTAWTQDAPGSFELQNGFLPQKTFDAAKQAFEEVQTPAAGLGVHFNETSCAHCHLAPPGARRLAGGSGPITELRAGYLARTNEFVPAPGGTLITTKALEGVAPEVNLLSSSQNIRDRFITTSLFGLGFVECVADDVFRRVARDQAKRSDGRIQGVVREVPILEAPGRTAVGRFGWAAQHASLLSFSADAYRNEMGVTSPLQPDDNTVLGNPV